MRLLDADGPRIRGAGPAEDAWRRSSWLGGLPRRDAREALGGVARLVVVSPHPDDETLGCGGLIAEAAALGVPVQVISVTDGEACYAGDPAWPPERARAVRRQELCNAVAALGLRPSAVVTLDLGDGRVEAGEARLVASITPHLRADDTVLATWRFDGHPDHEATGRAARAAAAAVGARMLEYPVWAWHWLDPEAGDPRLEGAVAWRLSASARAAKRTALQAFVSQRTRDGGAPILPDRVLARFERDFEVVLP